MKIVGKALKDQEDGLNFLRDKAMAIKGFKDGKDGKDADETKIVDTVLAKIQLPEYEETILDSPEEIKNKLQTLKGRKKLKISAISNLRKELDELKKSGGGIGGLRPSPTGVETPTGTINGTNKAFTVTFTPQWITLNGQNIYADNGYVLTSVSSILTITLDDAPLTGGVLRSHY